MEMTSRLLILGLFTLLIVGFTNASAGWNYPTPRVICDASTPIEQCRLTQTQCVSLRGANVTSLNAFQDIVVSIYQRTAFYSPSNTYTFIWKKLAGDEAEKIIATIPQPQSGDDQVLNFTINIAGPTGLGYLQVVFDAKTGGGNVYYSCADVSLVITEEFGIAVGYLTLVLLCISLAGALFTIITFAAFKSLRTFPIKLIMYLCVCIICGQSTFLAVSIISTQENRDALLYNNHFCVVAGALIHYFFLTNFFWCLSVAINLYLMIVKRYPEVASLEKFYHLIGWGVPLIIVVGVAGAKNQYGAAFVGGSCYLRDSNTIVFAFFLPGVLVVCANLVLFSFVAREVLTTLKKNPTANARQASEFRILVSIFISVGLVWITGFFVAVLDSVDIAREIFTLLFSIAVPSQGLCIFAAYCLNKKVMNRWRNVLCPCNPAPEEGRTSQGTPGYTSGAGKASSAKTEMSVRS